MPLVFVLILACGGKDGPSAPAAVSCDSEDLGSFTGNSTGMSAGALSGCAAFAVGEFDNGTWFSVAFTNGAMETGRPLIGINRPGGRPGPGTYSAGAGDGQFGGSILVDSGSRFFIVSSGTLTITASSASSISGSVNLTAAETGTSNTMTISGNFTAVCLPPNLGEPHTC
ncbi:MAG: hypothetical protein WD825_10015 [Gemmatimonadaceae bacterium]